jgi:SAM-dependent methyltransferase
MPDPGGVLDADAQTARIFEWRRGFNAMHLIDLGAELGLFGALADVPGRTAEEVAAGLGLHAPYVHVWCTTAFSLRLLDAEADAEGRRRYRLAPHVDQLLARESHPRYLGGYVRLGTRFATEDFRLAAQAFRTGEAAPFQGRSDDFAHTVGQAIAGVNVMVARKILPGVAGLSEALNAGGAVLEVGCGTGFLLRQLAKAFPGAACTGIDIDPTGLAAARQAVREAGLDGRVRVVEGDVATAVDAASFDVVVMVEVLHEIAPRVRAAVVQGCARALKPGGWFVIVDETYPSTLDEARAEDFQFPLQTGLEELTWGNVVPTRGEQEQLLTDAGLLMPPARSTFGAGFTLLVARKPG